jgi:hypothetical protein
MDWFCWENLQETMAFATRKIKQVASGSDFPLVLQVWFYSIRTIQDS